MFSSEWRPHMLRAIVINVGQGDSMLFQLPLKRWGLIDCNIASWREFAPVHEVIKKYEVSQLNILALTHPHSDHYLGMPQWIERYRDEMSEFWDSGLNNRETLVQLKKKRRDGAHLAQIYEWFDHSRRRLTHRIFRSRKLLLSEPDLEVQCLAPSHFHLSNIEHGIAAYVSGSRKTLPSLNLASGVVAMFYGKTCLLLGADATGASWQTILEVLQNRDMPKVFRTIVKVPHHGSRESNPKHAWEYLKHRMAATHAIISVSKSNRYSHPHDVTIERLLDLGIEVVCTSGIEYQKKNGRIHKRDTWTTVYERSGKYDEHGQNVELKIPRRGFPKIDTSRFG